METRTKEALAAGVFVEFCDACGNLLGQAIYDDWRGRPLPAVGDRFSGCVASPQGRGKKLTGRVRSRHFDVQTDVHGESCVWVRLLVDTSEHAAAGDRRLRVSFSQN
jgi:hypothetical protein